MYSEYIRGGNRLLLRNVGSSKAFAHSSRAKLRANQNPNAIAV